MEIRKTGIGDLKRLQDLLGRAVLNNIRWCEAVCRAHGTGADMEAGWWRLRGSPPPFYPHAISLKKDISVPLDLPPGAAVKDSYDQLAFDPAQWTRLFGAQWYGCEWGPLQADAGEVIRADGPEGLAVWLSAWGGTPEGQVIFRDELLRNPAVRFLMTADGLAGLAAYREGEEGARLVGISNLFGVIEGIAACLNALARPGDQLVGYGDAEELALLEPYGFRALGPLSVWLRKAG
ncbi:hypothetical protein [Aestuariispira insulae]|uniref:Uncharacterized protein n=1 Tax=Aestuariispira insulae TaxID=1461337 RepID=A0A3D9HRS5_9PROT|nr:hypothetical protein [Aestuariispira insulae]RED52105.1 hypothetical protein DFP90_102123 [Aestuariispira insulae]